MLAEPHKTALVLAIGGALMGLSVLLSRTAGRINVPVPLLYLLVGMLAGSEGLGRIPFDNYELAFRLGTTSLVLILFDGGLNTSLVAVKLALKPAATLASVGVVITAALVAVAAHDFHFSWPAAALLGAVVSSTDAASVFSILRGSRISLKKRVATTLELESGLNDPMAVLLTVSLTRMQVEHIGFQWLMVGEIALQIAVGVALGLAAGKAGLWLLLRLRSPAHGLLPVFTTALALVAFGVPTLFGGSGFLAVYIAALVVGNSEIPLRSGLLRVHDALAWFCQVIMFLVLGLLSTPSRLLEVGWLGLAIALFVAFVARPIAAIVCLVPFRYPAHDIGYVGWVGLRGAVPIILATFPVLAGVPDAPRIFDVVFFVVVINAIIPGATVRTVTRFLGLEAKSAPMPKAVLEINSSHKLRGDLLSFYIAPASLVAGARISDLPFPSDAAVIVIVRNEELIPPRGHSVLAPGDHVYVLCRREDRGLVLLLFGRSDSEE